MSKKITVEEFIEKLTPITRDAIEIIEFNGSSKPLTAKILKTGEIRTWTVANQLFKVTTGTFKPKRGTVHNSFSTLDYQNMLDKKFGEGLVKVLKFESYTKPVTIECSRCGEVKEYASGAHLKQIEFACQHCDRKYTSQEEFQSEIDEIFGEDEFKIIKFERMNKEIVLKHKCGFIMPKRDCVKVRNMLGCPVCERAKSKGERDIANFLLKKNIPFTTEKSFSDLRGDKYPLRYDFAIPHNESFLLIEYDGEGHYNPNSKYFVQNDNDKRKDEYCLLHNLPLLRIPYWEFKNINKLILSFLKFNDYPLGE